VRQRARALRGGSSVLTDQRKFEEAELMLIEARVIEPDNEITRRGLEFVREKLKRGDEGESSA